jgi:hypothetical protein
MHGSIISGTMMNPEILRLQTELASAKYRSPGSTKSLRTRQLEQELEWRKRAEARKALLQGDALDAAASRIEAQTMAERLAAAGYNKAQIQSIVRPMIVSPELTITGRAERRAKRAARKEARKAKREQRKAEGKTFGQRVKKGLKKVASGLARVNPVLVGGRAAFLEAVKGNLLGLASKLAKVDQGKLKDKFEGLGGRWKNLKTAIEKGAGAPVTGIYDDAYMLPDSMMANQVIGVAPLAAGAVAKGLPAILQAAKPFIEPILKIFGIVLDRKEKEQLDAVGDAPDAPEVRKSIEQAERDAEGGDDGGGLGGNMTPLLIGGAALAAILLLRKK